ncbi:YdeI/OmpD-associated family protein [Pareuzebyella sediminis]|uniref:YdeI/OmpD-associated family protein n=1 Tax=Pareuzebyella sediminis TaxID=2607998 RepID=UPI0011EF7767|nr:DUF1801 domain-containing protein [Pareuzebyella sediminis]
MNPKVDFFFDKPSQWLEAFKELRSIVLACGLIEELKWGKPCYTFHNSNVVLIHGFKAYCALLFHKGALLKDTNDILVRQTANVQAARQIRCTDTGQIKKMRDVLKAYIYQAIEVEKSGLEVPMKKTKDFDFPEELEQKMTSNSDLKHAFEKLTPGRQRGYLLYFSRAKQAKTIAARIEKYIPKILEGKGLKE